MTSEETGWRGRLLLPREKGEYRTHSLAKGRSRSNVIPPSRNRQKKSSSSVHMKGLDQDLVSYTLQKKNLQIDRGGECRGDGRSSMLREKKSSSGHSSGKEKATDLSSSGGRESCDFFERSDMKGKGAEARRHLRFPSTNPKKRTRARPRRMKDPCLAPGPLTRERSEAARKNHILSFLEKGRTAESKRGRKWLRPSSK